MTKCSKIFGAVALFVMVGFFGLCGIENIQAAENTRGTVEIDVEVSNTLNAGDVDVYTFTTPQETARYSIDYYPSENHYANIAIYMDADLKKRVWGDVVREEQKTSIIGKLDPNKEYYLAVKSGYPAEEEKTSMYTFKLTCIKDDAGDDGSSATEILLNETKTFGIQWIMDEDCFKVKTSAFESYKLFFGNVDAKDEPIRCTMYSGPECQKKQLVLQSYWTEAGEYYSISLPLEANKTYYLCIHGDIGTYKLGLIANPPASFSVKNSSTKDSNQVKVSWKKLGTASGYEVYRSTEKNGEYEKIATISKVGTTSYVDKSVSKGKTYYYKIRAIKKSGKKTDYTNFTAVKSVKIK